jgi:DNA invertase Pin-like site-specific DNA recombinase
MLEPHLAWRQIVHLCHVQRGIVSAAGKLIASLVAALAAFERDLLRERVQSRNNGGAET